MSFSLTGRSTGSGCYETGKWSSPDRGDSPDQDNPGRDGIAATPDVNEPAMADRVLSVLAWQASWPKSALQQERPQPVVPQPAHARGTRKDGFALQGRPGTLSTGPAAR
jgi:hypothetical protein